MNCLRLLLLGLCLALLQSCATQPHQTAERPGAEQAALAEQALAAELPGQAAALYQQAAEQAGEPQRTIWRLRAAELWMDADVTERARDLFDLLDADTLDPAQQQRRQLLLARLRLADDRAESAWRLLEDLAQAPAGREAQWLDARAQAWRAIGQPLEAARLRDELDALLPPGDAREDNRARLWQALNEIPMEALRQRMPPPPDSFGAWLELAWLSRSHRLDGARLREELNAWQERYPDHASGQSLVEALLLRYEQRMRPPERIAVLLPLSGPLAVAGQAVRDGLMAAWYAGPEPRPELRFHDTEADPARALNAYQQALDEGAQFILGPLTKESLAVLATRNDMPVPTLGLNTLENPLAAPSGLYQFGLAPEDDARAAAHYAINQGWRTALTLVPQNLWGERLTKAFHQAFEARGGRVLESAWYEPGANDFSADIVPLLNLDSSAARYRRLRSTLRLAIQHQPRRRQDADMLFIAGFPRQGRLLRPQLRYHHATSLPTVGSSHLYSGDADPDADKDLNGVLLMETPWVLHEDLADDQQLDRAALRRIWPDMVSAQPRLFAMGIDAYQLLPYLGLMRPEDLIEGRSGQLSLGADGRISRRLLPALMRRGELRPLADNQRYFGGMPNEPTAPMEGPESREPGRATPERAGPAPD
ncbi:penicillin-binding protein activator [Alkalilimnicola sp. S0819]|uniref:penicillin-binding protein activator n=1 Tax=Alkalilimnicola sp. S0819 TaxID=2613922 RepID=UPI001869836A|nr:penicillin-binding protein activator [Alkalilimnicola sp. S0819]